MTKVIRTTAHCLGARPLVTASIVVAALIVAARLQALQAPVTPHTIGSADNRSGRQVKLYDQLRVGLKARTKADLEFIDLVVLRVDQGKLPRKLVDSTFLWARNRYKTKPGSHRLRPIVYFQPALTLRAKQLGISL
ncbi:MAG: hypothetical protein KDA44_12770 [Planctomycetales bacterium]|nr:hypothetical protein [Planctomycetales bacterium]